jgi:hypothetical protein
MSNVTTHIFTPFWLGSLSDEDQAQVREWLTSAGVNINLCPGFDWDGRLITTRYYQVNEMGQAFFTEGEPTYEDQVREFSAPKAPQCVLKLKAQVN